MVVNILQSERFSHDCTLTDTSIEVNAPCIVNNNEFEDEGHFKSAVSESVSASKDFILSSGLYGDFKSPPI